MAIGIVEENVNNAKMKSGQSYNLLGEGGVHKKARDSKSRAKRRLDRLSDLPPIMFGARGVLFRPPGRVPE